MNLVELLQKSMQRVEGNTEVAATAAMETNEAIARLVKAMESSSSLFKEREAATVQALQDLVKESRESSKDDKQDQREKLKEKEQKDEENREEQSRMKKILGWFEAMGKKMQGFFGEKVLGNLGRFFTGIMALLTSYLFPIVFDLARNVLPPLAKALAWVFDQAMSIGEALGSAIGAIVPGLDAGVAGAVGAIAGLAAAIWVVVNPLKALSGIIRGAVGAVRLFKRVLAIESSGGAGGTGDVIPDGDDRDRRGRRGRQNRRPGRGRGGRVGRLARAGQAGVSGRAAPVARTAATGVPGRVVTAGGSGVRAGASALGRTGLRALPVVGTAATIGLGAYDAYTSVEDINSAVAAGEMTAAEASEAKGEAVGGAAGGVGGALAGAALGATVGSAVPVVGTIIGGAVGGLLGYYGGDWLGSEAGAAIGRATADTPTPPVVAVAPPATGPATTVAAPPVVPAPRMWEPNASDENKQEEFLLRVFKDQVDYFLMKSRTTPLVVQDIRDYRDAQAFVGTASPAGAPSAPPPRPPSSPPPAPAGTQSIPTTQVSGPMSADSFADLIGRAESRNDYSAFNDTYTDGSGRRRVRASYNTNLTGMTLGEVMAAQAEGSIFAAGRYQVIPDTLREAAAHLKLDPNDKFDSSMQDRIFKDYLITVKRPQIGAYLRGEGTLEAATLAAAREWASVGVPAGVKLNNGRISTGGESYYAGDGLNKAHVTVGEVQGALTASRDMMAAANRGTGTNLATASSQAAMASGSSGGSTVISTPVNAPTTIVQGGGSRTQPRRSAAPPAAVTYDVGAIA